MRALSVSVMMALALAATACSPFKTKADPTETYVLRASPRPTQPARDGLKSSIRVTRPLPSPGLETDHIMLLQTDRRLSHFVASRWAGTVPELVESLTVETLRAAGVWSAVQDSRSSFPSEYYLQINVRRFEADYTETSGAPTVHVRLDCAVGRRVDRELIASFTAEETVQASENRVGAVVEAFEKAAEKALATVAESVTESVRTSKAPSTP